MADSLPAGRRLDSIDQFRGFSILLMVLANFLAGATVVPAWLKHAPDIGLTLIDLIAPFFILAIGLTYGPAWSRHAARSGAGQAALQTARRYLAIAGLGSILAAGEVWLKIDNASVAWGVLQSIGVAGLVTLAVIGLPTWQRAVIGTVILAAYQVVLDRYWLADVLGAPHGGLPGSVSWSAMLILGTALADVFHAGSRGRYVLATVAALVIGVVVALAFPVSKNRVSPAYVLISLGLSGLVFAVFDWLAGHGRGQSRLLAAWGQNALALYVLHLLLLGVMVLPDIPVWYSDAPAWLLAFQGLGLLALLSGAGLWLQRRNIHIVF